MFVHSFSMIHVRKVKETTSLFKQTHIVITKQKYLTNCHRFSWHRFFSKLGIKKSRNKSGFITFYLILCCKSNSTWFSELRQIMDALGELWKHQKSILIILAIPTTWSRPNHKPFFYYRIYDFLGFQII